MLYDPGVILVILKKPVESVVVPLLVDSNLMDIPGIGFRVFLSIAYPLMRAWGIFCAFDAEINKVVKQITRRNLKFMSVVDDLKN
jgi:hypothetical protein